MVETPSYVGETVAVITVVNFAMWAVGLFPNWTKFLIIPFVFVFLLDWMLGGIADTGICKTCVMSIHRRRTQYYR
ncbi:hypothetical protein J4211_01645 [Candidatus Woesearchaeota archaeon]|nr:hypothetical protein [Candidatus Woesearchaeota archaeon]